MPGRFLTKERIYEKRMGLVTVTETARWWRSIFGRIRAKLAAAGALPYVKLYGGVGYRWKK